MILFYYIYNNCKIIHSKINNGKSNRSETGFFVVENHRGRCNCNIYITNTYGIFCYGDISHQM